MILFRGLGEPLECFGHVHGNSAPKLVEPPHFVPRTRVARFGRGELSG
jgi:hypothetical protein